MKKEIPAKMEMDVKKNENENEDQYPYDDEDGDEDDNSQILCRSIFGRDRRRGTIGEDRESQNALVDSDEMQPLSQPLDHVMITHGSSDAMGNLDAREDQYRWATEHASLVKEAYCEKGKNRLQDMVCKVSNKKPTDVIVTAAKFFSKIHIKPKDKTFVYDRSKATWVCIKAIHLPFFGGRSIIAILQEKYQLLKLAKQVPPSEEDNSLFLEAVGGWSEKRNVYELGNSKPTNNATANKPSYTPSVIAQLQTELDLMKTELNSIKNDIQQQRTSREKQQRKLGEQQRQLEEQKQRMEE
ncbi:hypothetical protein Cgig2_034115 [Carnegiea gigantea]|uniref:Uncharacterized protein n=1 Tax=Carnegiea gigantea TaxID=171969 RepID=A0A9Q1K2E9_9CARY|nr:hypothetical protein Cgig2_034115 [Carnegiea gigantea]